MRYNPTISARVTLPLRKLVSEYLGHKAYISEGEFIRDAIREKIRRDTPELYNKMLKRKEKSNLTLSKCSY